MKNKKPSGRSNKTVSATNKSLNSKAQDEHLDPFSQRHIDDVADTQKLRAWQQGKESEIPIIENQCLAVLGAAGFPMPHKHDSPISEFTIISPILDLRDNFCLEEQVWSQKRGSDWNAFISKERKKRSIYKEASGSIRKKGQLKFKSPLKTIFLRLPPWIASQLQAEQDEDFVKTTVCDLAEIFSKETGYPIIAANIHRENESDLHVHLVYSDVIKTPVKKKITKKRQRELLAIKRKEVREYLKASGLPAHSSNVKKSMDDLNLSFPEFEDTGNFEYRKIMRFGMGKNEWPTAKRNMHILGSAYRYKGQLWEAAETEKDKEYIREFRENNAYFDGSFTQRLCKRKDPESDYLDWWLEHEFSRGIYDQLDDSRKNEADISRQRSVKNYIAYGQNLINPAEIVWLDQQKELEEKDSLLNEDEKRLNSEKIAQIAKAAVLDMQTKQLLEDLNSLKTREGAIVERELQLTTSESTLKTDQATMTKKMSELKNMIKTYNQNFGHSKSNLSKQQKILAEREISLNEKDSSIAKSQSSLKTRETQFLQKEKTFNDELQARRNQLQTSLKKAVANLRRRRATLDVDKKEFNLDKETLREEGRQETLDAVGGLISPKRGIGRNKTVVLNAVRKCTAEARKFRLMVPVIRNLKRQADGFKESPACPKWLGSIVSKLLVIIDDIEPDKSEPEKK